MSSSVVVSDISYIIFLSQQKLIQTIDKTAYSNRPWHDARAIARARAITRANEEKGSLGSR